MKQYLVDGAFDSDAIRGDVGRYPDAQSSNLCGVAMAADDEAMSRKIAYFVNRRRCMLFGGVFCADSAQSDCSEIRCFLLFVDAQCNPMGSAPDLPSCIGLILLRKREMILIQTEIQIKS